MSLHRACVIPGAPLLIPDIAAGSAPLDDDLRSDTREVVRALVTTAQSTGSTVIVVGTGPQAGTIDGTWDWAPLGVPVRGEGRTGLPLALGIGAWFLDDAGYDGPRTYVAVAEDTSSAAAVRLGKQLADDDICLLVVGDGTACRDPKAPGYFSARAEDWDMAAAAALATADTDALIALDPAEARELRAAGRAPWQVLAGAASGQSWQPMQPRLLRHDARYGVAYLIADWQ